MKALALAVCGVALMGLAASAQPRDDHHGRADDHHGPAMMGHPAPAMAMRGHPAMAMHGGPAMGRHHLPHGFARPAMRHSAPMWHGRGWAVGDRFMFDGFRGPAIFAADYDLPSPRPGTHWIYVDGFFLMVGNRTGRIFAEVQADY